MQAKFAQASQITGEEFLSFLNYYAKAWLPARDVVKAAMDKRFEVDASGQIVVFHQVSHLISPFRADSPGQPISLTTTTAMSPLFSIRDAPRYRGLLHRRV